MAFEEDVVPGKIKHAVAGNVEVALVRLDGQVLALADICAHAHCNLSDGDLEGEEVVCPCHGSGFNARTGAVLNPPARHDVATYPVRVQDGQVFVEIP